jgi:hypothetical protein
MRKRRRSIYPRPKIGLQFVAHLPAMIRVLRELGLTARRILDCLELEHCRMVGVRTASSFAPMTISNAPVSNEVASAKV